MRIWVWRHASFTSCDEMKGAEVFEEALSVPTKGFRSPARAKADAEVYLTGNAIANGCPVPEPQWRGSDEGEWQWDFNGENDTILVSSVDVED